MNAINITISGTPGTKKDAIAKFIQRDLTLMGYHVTTDNIKDTIPDEYDSRNTSIHITTQQLNRSYLTTEK